MADEVKGDYSDAGNPTGEYDYLGHGNLNDNYGDQYNLERHSVPESHTEVSNDTKKSRRTPAKNVLEWLSTHAKISGFPISPDLKNYILSISAEDEMEERDIDMFMKGYVFCAGNRLINNMQAVVNDIQTEVRHLQREGNKNADILRSMERQGKATEMEIAAAVATIKTDMINAIKSAMSEVPDLKPNDGSVKLKTRKEKEPVDQTPILINPVVLKEARKPDPSISAIEVKEPESENIVDLKRVFMTAVGVDPEVVDVLKDEEVDDMIGTNEYYEYYQSLGDDDVRTIWYDIISEAIDKLQ
ncbi:TPA_asm: P [Euphorbia alphacytorhabdovirus 1]|nr:TPA_asm: P [Euphorbia alphacytorhabdovirus 1]